MTSFLNHLTDKSLLKMLDDLLLTNGEPPTRGGPSILYARGVRIAKKRGI